MSEEPLPISVCMIAGAEAPRICRALDSVAGWVGEIIIVINDDVHDGTDQIAAKYGAKVFREPWKGYVAQKNSAAEKAGHEWLLGLDADEVISPALRDEIRRAVTQPGENVAFRFPRCSIFCGRWIRHGDWYPDRQTRLWRRGQAVWEGTTVHEKLKAHGAVGHLKADMLHYTGETIDQQISKIVIYTNDFARDARSRKRASWLDLLVRPVWRFLRGYFIRLGFLDGWQGYYIAWMTAFYTVTRYAKIRAAQEQKDKPA